MAKRLNEVELRVKAILTKNEVARGNDKYLYKCYLESLGLNTRVSLATYLLSGDYPSYDGVTRTRRKLQEKYPELLPKDTKRRIRKAAEQDYIEYALGK